MAGYTSSTQYKSVALALEFLVNHIFSLLIMKFITCAFCVGFANMITVVIFNSRSIADFPLLHT